MSHLLIGRKQTKVALFSKLRRSQFISTSSANHKMLFFSPYVRCCTLDLKNSPTYILKLKKETPRNTYAARSVTKISEFPPPTCNLHYLPSITMNTLQLAREQRSQRVESFSQELVETKNELKVNLNNVFAMFRWQINPSNNQGL